MSASRLSPEVRRAMQNAAVRIQRLEARLAGLSAPVALLGQACRFPGAPEAESFRRLLDRGEALVGVTTSADRPELKIPAALLADPVGFDRHAFGLSAAEAEGMDPQHRMLLEVSLEALQDATLPASSLAGRAVGVFMGVSTCDDALLTDRDQLTSSKTLGHMPAMAAGRLAWLLDLRGPTLTLDAACASVLAGIHHAVEALRRGACELAIVGGVNLILDPMSMRATETLGVLSPTGQSRPFDAAADGFVRGEGCGVFVLAPLEAARAAGHPIRAVIRGSGLAHGGRAAALAAPRLDGQLAAMRAALKDAGLDASDVHYVEAHATGTPIGDAIEAEALASIYPAATLVGASKGSTGHLEAAAGAASLMKTVTALGQDHLPPTAGLSQPGAHIQEVAPSLKLVTRATPWPTTEGPRRAGVCAFGLSGTCAHVIVEAAPEPPARSSASQEGPLAVLISAPDDATLPIVAQRMADAFEQAPAEALRDLCLTAAVGRDHGTVRAVVAAPDREALVARLRSAAWSDPLPWPPLARWWAGGDLDATQIWPGARRRHGLRPHPWRRTSQVAAPRLELSRLSPSARHRALVDHLSAVLREALGLGSDTPINPDRGLVDLGLSSLKAIELAERVETELGVSLSASEALASGNVSSLARRLLDALDTPTPSDDLDDLDEAALEALLEDYL